MSDDFLTPTSGEVLYREMVAPTIYVPRYQNWFTPEEDAELRRLWAEGLSTRIIGTRMGRSKNSIIGRAHRLQLLGRASPIVPADPSKPPRRKRARHRGQLAAALAQEGETLNQAPDLHALNELKSAEPRPIPPTDSRPCQYPVSGEGKRTAFCGANSQVGKPYCPPHSARCFTAPLPRKIDGNAIDRGPLCAPLRR
jgi:GcrA cell cycle regulator